MALPNGTGGYQPNTGNTTQPEIRRVRIVVLTGAAMLLAASDVAAHISITSAVPSTLTTPTGQALDDLLPNATVGHSFITCFTCTAPGDITLTPSAGITIAGRTLFGPTDGGAQFRFVKTGVATWTAFRI